MVYTIFTKPVLFFYMRIKTTLSKKSSKKGSLFNIPHKFKLGGGSKPGGGAKKSKKYPPKNNKFLTLRGPGTWGGGLAPPRRPPKKGGNNPENRGPFGPGG